MFQFSREAPKIHLKYPITRKAILAVYILYIILYFRVLFHDGGHVESIIVIVTGAVRTSLG